MSRVVFCLLLTLLSPSLAVADFSGPVVSILDGDTIEVLHHQRHERIRLPQSQRHPTERRLPLNRKKWGGAHSGVPLCVIWKKQNHIPLSYGYHKIAAPSTTNAPTIRPMVRVISMITSWVDGGSDYDLF